MRRSSLFIPANRPGMMQNAAYFNADSIIFDLEDAISFSEKDAARVLLKEFLDVFKPQYEVIVRINALDHLNGLLDLELLMGSKIDTIMLPKADYNTTRKLASLLDNFERARKIEKKTAVVPLIELATSILEVEEISRLERVNGMLLGAEDLTNDLEIERTKTGEEIIYPRARLAFAAHAVKIDAIDTPFTDVIDEEGLEADCIRARNLGMTSKSAIHPNQIPIINRIFSPTSKQIAQALKIIEASASETGVFSLDGKMIDKPIIERSKKLIEKAKRFDLL